MEKFNKVLAGNRIKSRRLELELTLSEIANMIGVAPSTIQRYEAGSIARPKIPVLKAIASALGVSYSWITGGADEIANMPANAYPAVSPLVLPAMRIWISRDMNMPLRRISTQMRIMSISG